MITIKPTKQYVEPMLINGLCTRTNNSDEFDPVTAKIPALWQQIQAEGFIKESPIYGVYTDYESDATGYYTLTIGITDTGKLKNQARIAAGDYLVFENTGPMPDAIIKLWQYIWNYFSENATYQRNFISDFEVYHGEDRVQVYIGVK